MILSKSIIFTFKKTFDWIPDELHALPNEALKTGEPATIDLVPYGCTKFRVSMFL